MVQGRTPLPPQKQERKEGSFHIAFLFLSTEPFALGAFARFPQGSAAVGFAYIHAYLQKAALVSNTQLPLVLSAVKSMVLLSHPVLSKVLNYNPIPIYSTSGQHTQL